MQPGVFHLIEPQHPFALRLGRIVADRDPLVVVFEEIAAFGMLFFLSPHQHDVRLNFSVV